MYNTLNIDLEDANVLAVTPDISIFGGVALNIEISNEYISLNLRITEKDVQEIFKESCKISEYDTYEELEDRTVRLRDKLMKLKDNYDQLKEAYEELKRR